MKNLLLYASVALFMIGCSQFDEPDRDKSTAQINLLRDRGLELFDHPMHLELTQADKNAHLGFTTLRKWIVKYLGIPEIIVIFAKITL